MKKLNALLTGMLVCLLMCIPVSAAEEVKQLEKKQIIFLLDASQSMKQEGRWESVIDSAVMIAAALPENYEAAVMVYNTEIVFKEDFGKISRSTKESMEKIDLQGYTCPTTAMEMAVSMFDNDAAVRRIIFVSDGEISKPDAESTIEAVESYRKMSEETAAEGIKIDMFALPGENIENMTAYGPEVSDGALYTAGEKETLEEIAAEYLFEVLKTEKIELGESFSGGGKLDIDLQDTYLQTASIVLVSKEEIADFQIAGQCEKIETVQGSRFTVAKVTNPLENHFFMEYMLKEKAEVRFYLIKEYNLQVQAERSYTSETGVFEIETSIKNHQGKSVLDAEDLKKETVILLNGKAADYKVEKGNALLAYETMESENVTIEVITKPPGSIIHSTSMTDTVELIVPAVEKEQDYRVLWIVLITLFSVLLLIFALYKWKNQKKNDTKEDILKESRKNRMSEILTHDFSGQITLYLLQGEMNLDLPPKSIKLFGMVRKKISFAWIKDKCGIHYRLLDADKIYLFGGKDNTLCFKNRGSATILKSNELLRRDRKYDLYYGEKILLVFNDGETEMELHYKNIKPSER